MTSSGGYINRQRQRIEDIKDRIQSKDTDRVLHSTQHDFYWVYGLTPSGKRVTLGPYTNAGEADRRASQLVDAEIHELPTRDRGRAVQMVRTKLLKQGEAIDRTLERQLGEKGLQREKKRFGLFKR